MSDQTILIVEDNEIQREGVAAVLRKAGYRVILASDATEAIALLTKGGSANLILLDMMIPQPGTDGWRFMERRKKRPVLASVPVLIMTAMGIASDAWAASLGACALIRKPMEVELLLSKVKECLDGC